MPQLQPGTCTDAEWAFWIRWKQFAPDLDLEAEYRFDTERRWRFDFADPVAMVAVEIEGGAKGRAVTCQNCGTTVRAMRRDPLTGHMVPGAPLRIGGRHTRSGGFENDAEKYNAAAAQGWVLFRFTPQQVEDDPGACILPVADRIRQRRSTPHTPHP